MKQKQILGIIVLSILVLSMSFVSAGNLDDNKDFLQDIKNTIFTSLGQQANCDITPCDSGTTSSFLGERVNCCSSGGKYPGSDECLINVFHANYEGSQAAFECGEPGNEFNNCVEYIATDGGEVIRRLTTDSPYEVYNCPTGSLTQESIFTGDPVGSVPDCDCSYGATSSTCDSTDTCSVTKPICFKVSGDDVCISNAQSGIECPNGLDGSSTACECDYDYSASSWKMQRCPSSKPTCNQVTGYDSCSVSTPDPTPDPTPTDPAIDVVIYDINVPTSVKAGEEVRAEFKVKNNGPTRDYLIEVGIIPKKTADAWEMTYGLFDWTKDILNIQDATECCEGQPNIFGKTTELKTGEIDTFKIDINKAPYSEIKDLCNDNDYWDGTGEYVVYIIVKNKCFKDGGLANIYKSKLITISEEDIGGATTVATAKTFTWTDYYSMNNEKFAKGNYLCSSTSECPLKSGYDVSCIANEEFTERIYDYSFEKCDETAGWWNELISVSLRISTLNLIKGDFCSGYTFFKEKWDNLVGKPNDFCLAESNTWYGKAWDSTLKTIGGMGLPIQYVMIITIMLLFGVGIILFNQINK